MRDISFVSTLLVFLKKGIEEDIGNSNLNQIYDLYNDEYPDKEDDKTRFTSITDEIDSIIDSNDERIKILRRQVHFYSLFTVIYDITNSQANLNSEQIKNYQDFIDNYDNDKLLTKKYPDQMSNIYQYKSLVKEGTRQKSNRFERHKSLKIIMNKTKPNKT